MNAAWRRWVALWSGVEHPRSIGLVRLLLGLTILWDFVEIWRLDLVVPLFGVVDTGGLSDVMTRETTPAFYRIFPGTVRSAWLLWGLITGFAATFTLGLFTRTSAVLLLLAWAQFSHVLPAADRGIDTLCRDVLTIFAFASSGRWLGVDAWVRTGSLWGDGAPVSAWPRRLLILQIVAMYFLAGVQKTGIHWYPMGSFAALYFILQDPAIARFDFTWLERQPYFLFTQVATATTIVFQDTYPMVLILRWLRTTDLGVGRWRAFANRWGWTEWIWISIGAFFHLALAATCELGIFPWAMLAIYPAWVHPDDWSRWAARWFPSRAAPVETA